MDRLFSVSSLATAEEITERIVNISAILDNARRAGKRSLSESDSKKVVRTYGIPAVREIVAADAEEAVKAAEKLGYPVVLKAHGAAITHKTEGGLVHAGLCDADAVRNAAKEISQYAGAERDGFLVQPFVRGKREFVAGLFRDARFGPVVMFGAGGVFTEALSDVAFRLAPVEKCDAAEMLEEIRARKLLDDFRGERAANREALIQTLLGLSQIGIDHPEIAEIDINPLIATPDGDICAVDALVVLNGDAVENDFPPPVDPVALGKCFHPKSVVFIGATSQMGKWGHILPTLTLSRGFKGDVFFVNPKGGMIAGRQAYASVSEIPGTADLAIVTIPASGVRDLVPRLKAKGIPGMLLITSGFAETGDEGRELEKKLVREAREAGILILGPNTMGICNPHIDFFCTGVHVSPRAGSTAIVTQSGNIGAQLLGFSEKQGIGIRGFSGSGNEAMVTIEDYLEGFEIDDKTRNIMLYMESVKNGRRFFEVSRRIGKTKPIILLQGGRTEEGGRAAASHTGALAANSAVFDAMCKQAGIVRVDHPMDLLDLSAAFSSLPVPKGNRTAIMTIGGGWGVVASDLCSDHDLEIPDLPDDIVARIDKILPPYWSRSNPVDIVGEHGDEIPAVVLEELLKWDGCDAVVNLGIMGKKIMVDDLIASIRLSDPAYSEEFLAAVRKHVAEFEKKYAELTVELMEKYGKPVFGVSIFTEDEKTVFRVEGSDLKGVFYPTPERAVRAFAGMYRYCRFKERFGLA